MPLLLLTNLIRDTLDRLEHLAREFMKIGRDLGLEPLLKLVEERTEVDGHAGRGGIGRRGRECDQVDGIERVSEMFKSLSMFESWSDSVGPVGS